MPISVRLPPEINSRLKELAGAKGKTKTALILEALEEKYNLRKSRRDLIRESAGWMSPEEAAELRDATAIFNQVDDEDWA
jgi:predicted transcriptional regulator